MLISDEKVKEFQALFKKKYGKNLTMQEASDAAHNLVNFFDVLMKIEIEDIKRKDRLKKEPKGFNLDDGKVYTCCICKDNISDKETWYDKGGMKCLHCQKALDKKIIPMSVCKNDKSWYSIWEFDYYFKIKSPTVRKFIRHGKLKSRVIPDLNTGKSHCEIILIKDNKDILPNKPESYSIKDEKGMIHSEYEEVDISKLTGEDNEKKHLEVTAEGV